MRLFSVSHVERVHLRFGDDCRNGIVENAGVECSHLLTKPDWQVPGLRQVHRPHDTGKLCLRLHANAQTPTRLFPHPAYHRAVQVCDVGIAHERPCDWIVALNLGPKHSSTRRHFKGSQHQHAQRSMPTTTCLSTCLSTCPCSCPCSSHRESRCIKPQPHTSARSQP